VLVDGAGETLYTWDRDTGPTSTCVGSCASTWPPLMLPAGTNAPVAGAGVSLLTAAPRPDDAAKPQVNWTTSRSTTTWATPRPATSRATASAAPGTS
jgi:hypothetical protein